MFEAYMQGSELGIHEEDPLPQYHQAGRATPPPPHTPTGRDNPYIQQQPNTTEYSATLAEQMTYTSGAANGYQYREMRQTRAQSIATPSARDEDLPVHQSFAQPPLQLPVKPPKPPLHPSAPAGSSFGGGSNARSRTPSSTPPPQAHSPLPVQGRQPSPQPQQPLTGGADRGYPGASSSSSASVPGGGGPDPRDAELRQLQQRAAQDAAALEKQRLMLKMQTEELMENERAIQRLQASGGGGGGGAEVHELRAQLDEAGQLTEAAGELLQKVQGDLDGAQQAAEAIVQRVFPGELERLSFDAVPDLVRFVGTRVEEVLQGTLEAAGKLEEELTRTKQEAVRAAASKPAGRSADVQRLESELDAAAARNTELTTNIAALQEEVATLRMHEAELAHTDGQKQGELEDDVKQLRSQLNRAEQARTDAERQRQSQAQLLKMTEQAYKKLEEELRAARRAAPHEAAGYVHDAEGQTMQSELHKLGAVSNGPSVWKKRYFFANTTCLQYMDKPEDVGKPALVKGERYAAYLCKVMFS